MTKTSNFLRNYLLIVTGLFALALSPLPAFAATTFGPSSGLGHINFSYSSGGFFTLSCSSGGGYLNCTSKLAEINPGTTYTVSSNMGINGEAVVSSKTTSRIYFTSEFGSGSLVEGPSGSYFTLTEVVEPVPGCTDPEAENYDEEATEDDDSCTYPEEPGGGGTRPAGIITKTDAEEAVNSAYTDALSVVVIAVAAVIGAAAALVGVGYGWHLFVKRVSGPGLDGNMPGSSGYNSQRGSGASSGNVARMESDGSAPGGPKVYRF